MDDIIALVSELKQNANQYIILMLDANETLDDKERRLVQILKKTTLIDTFTHHTNLECNLPSYERGSKRIDYILTTSNMLQSVSKVGYLKFGEDNIISDHCGMFIDIQDSIIDSKVEFVRPEKRNISSKSKPTQIYNYKKGIFDNFNDNNIFNRATSLFIESKTDNVNKIDVAIRLNKLDLQITEIVRGMEKKIITCMPNNEWSI